MTTTMRPYILVETTQDAYRCIPATADWGEAWLASLERSFDQIEAGQGIRFDDDDEFFAALDVN